LEVDARAYTGEETRIKLIDHAARIGNFAPEDIFVSGYGEVIQTSVGIWLHRSRGTMVIVY